MEIFMDRFWDLLMFSSGIAVGLVVSIVWFTYKLR